MNFHILCQGLEESKTPPSLQKKEKGFFASIAMVSWQTSVVLEGVL